MHDIKSIGVIGFTGMVGSTVHRYFKEQKQYEVFGYSRKNQIEQKETLSSDCIFVCLPTPFDWHKNVFEIGNVEAVIHEITGSRIVVIKSTVPIGTTERIQSEHPILKILFNPEFLSEVTAYGDFVNPDRSIIGFTKESFTISERIMRLLPLAPYEIICPSKEAEFLKYIHNLHGVLEVVEANHYYDVCKKEGLDYDRIKKAMVTSKYMGKHYKEIFHKGYRGIGGKCFPKDLNAYLSWCREKGIDTTLFSAVKQANIDILSSQNLTEKEAESK